ncbi:MAG: DUF4037 domain-containing protein [Spirochaetaceae bacterium]|jgi:hypothetical protein|nr:DUF4037 domain-containing protein [Spirochaetaceae bacterium]
MERQTIEEIHIMAAELEAMTKTGLDKFSETAYNQPMKYQVKTLIEKYTGIISQWESVECITLNEAAHPDTLDPYFALILDVFYSGSIPPPAERAVLYGDTISVFENSGGKDRFLSGNIPVRFEFKDTKRSEELVSIAASRLDSLYLIKDSGTYSFYRLNEGEILFSRGGWIYDLRKKLAGLGDEFWKATRDACQSKMEHFLSDLGAAFIQNDDFFYLMSSAGFIKAACLTLLCINKRFEPSHRQYHEQVLALPILPNSFSAQLDTFLRQDAVTTMEHKYNAAQLIARGIVVL